MNRITIFILCLLTLITPFAAKNEGDAEQITADYIGSCVSEDSTAVDSEISISCQEIRNNTIEPATSPFKVRVYTYRDDSGSETPFHTIIAMESLERVGFSVEDEIRISPNDYLRIVSPAKGQVYTKSDPSAKWNYDREISAIAEGLSCWKITGLSLPLEKRYVLILFDFPSLENPESMDGSPVYLINFLHDGRLIFSASWLWILLAVAVASIILLRRIVLKNQQKNK